MAACAPLVLVYDTFQYRAAFDVVIVRGVVSGSCGEGPLTATFCATSGAASLQALLVCSSKRAVPARLPPPPTVIVALSLTVQVCAVVSAGWNCCTTNCSLAALHGASNATLFVSPAPGA